MLIFKNRSISRKIKNERKNKTLLKFFFVFIRSNRQYFLHLQKNPFHLHFWLLTNKISLWMYKRYVIFFSLLLFSLFNTWFLLYNQKSHSTPPKNPFVSPFISLSISTYKIWLWVQKRYINKFCLLFFNLFNRRILLFDRKSFSTPLKNSLSHSFTFITDFLPN